MSCKWNLVDNTVKKFILMSCKWNLVDNTVEMLA
jgi:hypothetical protein